MKFTIDLENQRILIHSPFTANDLEKIIDRLNIENIKNWTIDIYTDSKLDYSYTVDPGFFIVDEFS